MEIGARSFQIPLRAIDQAGVAPDLIVFIHLSWGRARRRTSGIRTQYSCTHTLPLGPNEFELIRVSGFIRSLKKQYQSFRCPKIGRAGFHPTGFLIILQKRKFPIENSFTSGQTS